MRILAIECATEACSAALFDGGALVDGRCETIGRGHAERLVPMIAELPARGRADRILVSLGPGSFTGVRIGLAAARALGLAWGADVLGYPTLALVAAMARARHPDAPVTVCMNGGHGEFFVQDYGVGGLPTDALAALAADMAHTYGKYPLIAGNKARAMAAGEGSGAIALDILPDARHALAVPDALLTLDLTPIYGRAPDAKLPSVRA